MVNSMVVLTKKEYKISFWDVGNIPYLDLDCGNMCVCTYLCVCLSLYMHIHISYLLICMLKINVLHKFCTSIKTKQWKMKTYCLLTMCWSRIMVEKLLRIMHIEKLYIPFERHSKLNKCDASSKRKILGIDSFQNDFWRWIKHCFVGQRLSF